MILRRNEMIVYLTKGCKISTGKIDKFNLFKFCIYPHTVLPCKKCKISTYCEKVDEYKRYSKNRYNNIIVFFNEITIL